MARLTYAGPRRDLIENFDDIAWVGLARRQAEVAAKMSARCLNAANRSFPRV